MGGRPTRRADVLRLSPFRPTLALLFNFPQDNNPMTTLTIAENERIGRVGRGGDRRKTYGCWGGRDDVVDECRVNHLSHVELVVDADPSSLSKGPTLTVVVGDSFRVARMGSRALRFVLPACRRRGASALVALLAGAPSSCRQGPSADFWLE